jgi:arsenate reductase (glutaredoxin)
MSMNFYHYPKCRKSRAALEFVRQQGIEPVIINYVEEGLSEQNLWHLLELLQLSPFEMVRQNEEFYKENFKHISLSDEQWVATLCKYPKLLKRPIVVYGNRAVLADPPQNINQVLTVFKQDL